MSKRIRMTVLMAGTGLLLAACSGNSSSGSGPYYDPYPYRSDIYYHYGDYYDRNDGNSNNRPEARPPMRPVHLPARGGRLGGGGGLSGGRLGGGALGGGGRIGGGGGRR